MSDDYPGALEALRTNTPLTPLQFDSLILSQTQQEIQGSSYLLDNSNNVWDPTEKYGPLIFANADSTSKTITIYHGPYVGPQQSGTISSLQLPPEAINRLVDAINTNAGYPVTSPEDFAGWALIAIGIGLIAAGIVLTAFTVAGGTPLIYLGVTAIVAGIGLMALNAYSAAVTPVTENKICNTTNTACCYDVVSPATGSSNHVCVTCPSSTSTGCTSSNTTTTPGPGAPGNVLVGIAWGLAGIAVVGLGSYAAYKYIRSRPFTPRPYTPAPPSTGSRPLSQRSGLLPRAYRGAREVTGKVYEGAKRTLIGS